MKGQQSKINKELHEVPPERNDKQVGKVDMQTMTDLEQPKSEEEEGNDVVRKMDQQTMTDLPTCEYGGNKVDEVRKIDQQTMTDQPTNQEQGNDDADLTEVKFMNQFYSQYNVPCGTKQVACLVV